MLLSLMVYVVTVSLLLALAAWAFERAVRVFAFPTRWIWAGAMTGSLAYTLLAILRPPASSLRLETTPLDALLSPVISSITQFADPTPAGVSLDTFLGVGWVVLTLVVVAVLLRAHLRLRSDRSTWTRSKLDGREVLVSEDLGPGVVGWIRSAVVMPRWAFRMSPQKQELMLQHEAEHCSVGDTQVAGVALLCLTLLPWNLPLWWQIHRLRLAIEIDCDRRVLYRSADVKRYARLLVEIGARGTASRLSALAFARPIPSIELRILAMTDTRDPRYMRTVGLALLAVLLVVASCAVDPPMAPPVSSAAGEADPPIVEVEPPQSQSETTTSPEEALQAALRALRAGSDANQSQDVAPAQAGPVFTPMTVRPEITNRVEVQAALMREYPDLIRQKADLTRAGRYAELAQRPAAPNPRRPAMFVAGIDAHATYSVIAIVSNTGQLVHGPVRIHNKEADRLDELLSQYRPLEVVVETSPAWPWLFDRLEGSGIHFVLAHAKRLRVIAESNYKSDEIDAELLARMRLAGLIPEVHPKCIAQREQAVLLRNRARLVRERTRMVNRIHAQIHNVGLHLERGRLLTQDGRQWVRDVAWPLLGEERRLFIDMQWELIDQIVPMIRTLDRRVEHMGQKIPAVALLETVPGIGPYRALLIATETLPIERFHTPAHLVSYAGLAPRSSQSGLRPIRHGSIPAGANRWLRGTFVRAVVSHVTHAPDSWLSQSYEQIKGRLGWQVARVATARRLARAVHAMLRTGEVWHDEPVTPPN